MIYLMPIVTPVTAMASLKLQAYPMRTFRGRRVLRASSRSTNSGGLESSYFRQEQCARSCRQTIDSSHHARYPRSGWGVRRRQESEVYGKSDLIPTTLIPSEHSQVTTVPEIAAEPSEGLDVEGDGKSPVE